jgi:Zn/Cd-binding protein ZinT
MKEKTAVDWFWDEVWGKTLGRDAEFFAQKLQQAKQMEKEQIKAAYNRGYQDGEIDSLGLRDGDVQYFDDAEQYYNETFGGKI